MANKHRRKSKTYEVESSLSPSPRDDVPRRVIVDFDRWIESRRFGDMAAADRLHASLRRSGYEPRITSGVSNVPVYWLRRL